jgi:hypothetical protein
MQQTKIEEQLTEMYGRLDESLEVDVRRRDGYLSVHDGGYTSITVKNTAAFEFKAEGRLSKNESIQIVGTKREVIERIQNRLKF